jgi:uncharacterized protein YdaU (DUF1376 family)
MFHYPHHIGDFDKATRHLTRLERSIYRDLLDFYYESEKQLPLDLSFVCRRILANSNEERTAVEQVLNEFFHKTPDGWYHIRCEAEIDKFHANISQKSEAGKRSAEKRALKLQQALNGRSTDVQRHSNGTPTNQEPEPITVNQIKDMSPPSASTSNKGTRLPENWVLPKAWGDWALSEKTELTSADIRLMAEMFKDHWLANANRATGKKADWSATWRNWVRNQKGGNYEANRRFGKTSITEKRHSIGEFIEREANAAAARLSEGAVSEDEGDLPPKMGLTVFK